MATRAAAMPTKSVDCNREKSTLPEIVRQDQRRMTADEHRAAAIKASRVAAEMQSAGETTTRPCLARALLRIAAEAREEAAYHILMAGVLELPDVE